MIFSVAFLAMVKSIWLFKIPSLINCSVVFLDTETDQSQLYIESRDWLLTNERRACHGQGYITSGVVSPR